jgi:hypothetical protein
LQSSVHGGLCFQCASTEILQRPALRLESALKIRWRWRVGLLFALRHLLINAASRRCECWRELRRNAHSCTRIGTDMSGGFLVSHRFIGPCPPSGAFSCPAHIPLQPGKLGQSHALELPSVPTHIVIVTQGQSAGFCGGFQDLRALRIRRSAIWTNVRGWLIIHHPSGGTRPLGPTGPTGHWLLDFPPWPRCWSRLG